jgi:E1A/CREB-binding protein
VRQTIRQSNEKEKSQHGSSDGLDPEQQLLVSVTADMAPPEPYEPQPKRRKSNHQSTTGGGAISIDVPRYSNEVASMSVSRKEAVLIKKNAAAAKDSGTLETENDSLINSFSIKDIETHLASLDRTKLLPPAKLKTKCTEVLKGLQNHQHGWVFNNPVDPVELGLPDYFAVIKKPMDLGTIQKKIDCGAYHAIEDFQTDVQLTFDNAMQYNEDGSVVYDMASELKTKFISDFKKLLSQLDAEDRERRRNDRACILCGCEKLLFEPPVFFCNGMNCQSKRIRRNSHFYIGGNNQYFWCNQCYNELDDASPIELMEMSVTKDELKKKKNDEVHEESWVQCDDCQCWIHQICGLFNSRQNKEHHSKYFCPKCLLKKKKRGVMTNVPAPPGASELPRTKLSECLESHVREKVEEKIKQLAMEKAKTEVRYFVCRIASPFRPLAVLTFSPYITEHSFVGGNEVA